MKKLAVLAAVAVLAAFAAPAFSATNPFMDVPMNHWAYDAIGQLAAHGIISGYPDGLFNGQKASTRYEMASTIARALAVVDMTKASKQDVEMMKRLVVEFRDELEALGVRVDELDERVAVFEDRLGGWKINGALALQVVYQKKEYGDVDYDESAVVNYDDIKLIFDRRWGENDEYHFVGRLNGAPDDIGEFAKFDRFYVEMPFFFDSQLTVGRFAQDWEGAYRVGVARDTGGYVGLDQVMTNWAIDAFEVTKNFGLGRVDVVLAHPDNGFSGHQNYADGGTWMLAARGAFQFTEQIGIDLGGSYFMGDNKEEYTVVDANNNPVDAQPFDGAEAFDNLMIGYFGAHYNLNDNIGFKGVFYMEKLSEQTANLAQRKWVDADEDSFNHWAVMVDVKQPALKYTSLWLEYGQYDEGFMTRNSTSITASGMAGKTALADIKYYRLALGQEWNDQWATHIFYYGYDGNDTKPNEIGAGVQYTLNDATTMGLNYIRVGYDDDDVDDDNIIRFRTAVSF